MSYTNGLDKPTDYFNTKLYTGTGATHSITGVGFQPDWVWIKERSSTSSHALFDSIRGATIKLSSNNTDANNTSTADLTSFDSDGFTNGDSGAVNESGQTYASWNWKANGSGSSNTDGSITSTVSANTTSGFSIVSYTGNGSAGATIGHGLGGVVPNVIIAKKLNNTSNWSVYHSGIGNFAKTLSLNTTSGTTTDSGVWDNVPTSSTFLVGSDNTTNANGDNYIAYCFAEKKGFSKFGSYTGNGSTDGTFIYTGFKIAFYLWKRIDSAGEWFIVDNKRDTENITEVSLKPNTSEAESIGNGYNGVDFLSNGVKVRQANSDINNSSGTYIYMAFAESPFVTSTGIPTTAR
jgi:hypothetical protein